MLKSFSFSQHCSSSGCGAVSPSLPFPCSFPLCSAGSFVLVCTAASICCQKATWPWSFCTHSPDPATWNLPLSHPLSPTGCTWRFRCHCPFLLLSNPLGTVGAQTMTPHRAPEKHLGRTSSFCSSLPPAQTSQRFWLCFPLVI